MHEINSLYHFIIVDVLTSINNKREALFSYSENSRSASETQQLEVLDCKNVFHFQELGVVCIEADILPYRHHGAIVKSALSKFTSNILKAKMLDL